MKLSEINSLVELYFKKYNNLVDLFFEQYEKRANGGTGRRVGLKIQW